MAKPDLIFTRGPIHTGDPARTRASSLAVTGERITAVGHDEVRELIGPDTEVIDLQGKLLLPGFQDSHIHAVSGGMELAECDLTGTVGVEEYLTRIRSYADAHPDRPWITGGGWSMESFDGGLPTRQLLDSVIPDRPVLLSNRDHHGAWANTRALELAGLTRESADPADGRIEREPDGTPSGMLQEGATALVSRIVPPSTPEDRLAGLLRSQKMLHSLGITGWQDALLGSFGGNPDPSDAYLTAAREGTLTARVSGALWWDRDRGAEQIPELLSRREQLSHGRFRARAVKIMQDGIAENFTAAMNTPYLDGCGCATANSGLSFVDPVALRSYVTELDAHDFQVHFHALGDRAVREALDAVQAAVEAHGRRGNRHHLAHLQVVHPDDLDRFARLGAIANIQPLWAAHEPQMDELTIPFLGPERASWQYPFGSLLRAGATLAAGSDWPVSSPDPIAGIHVAVNRMEPEATDGRVFLPEQRLDLATAVAAYTAGSAHVNGLDDTGSLLPGHLADLVVLDRDIFTRPQEEIAEAQVLRTYVGGTLVHSA
ncbi:MULTISPECIES: amidohydrolase [unclassified Streptomyces]|uniref:amidohydrolase n=1 Tax=unclassified Streptomyces TaxID=2593676 RepID=UPI002256EF43|nr:MULTISPECIES: amidohydrolase [unclassified Streptomyces]WSP53634.1 amidohydrolase family protein [Streptomyces sp. NBC_01241]MCX4785026.1 amidohydrolase family protein [Streptomyces sp. NBC_01221]MCX4799034.1 amidohydrolase family protein [Streptomyces sp. NBC_01242]WSJ40225.1 amidohydrolase family protein [Streptomyces sp. NBC_01321]WSP66529.1 amidohydrolase family protein [Streptomyces sp. NBC_01240]